MPDTLATVAAILLAGTFLIAASLKLVNPVATRRSMHDFGLPRPHVMAVAIPATELATAVLLLVDPAPSLQDLLPHGLRRTPDPPVLAAPPKSPPVS